MSTTPGLDFYTISRYHFNGQEADQEIAEGILTAEFWEYDSRLGRRWNIDLVIKPIESPYSVIGNTPIRGSDPMGNDWIKMPSGTFEFDPNIHSQEEAQKAYAGSLWHQAHFDVTYSDGSTANFRSDGSIFFSSEQRAYSFMWENSTAHEEQYDYKENSAVITPNGVLVLPSYYNNQKSSSPPDNPIYGYKMTGTDKTNMTVTDTKTGESWKMIGFIHTHSVTKEGNVGQLSSSDLWSTKDFKGVPVMVMEFDNKVLGATWYPGDDGYTRIDMSKITRDELIQGKEELIPWLNKYSQNTDSRYSTPGTE